MFFIILQEFSWPLYARQWADTKNKVQSLYLYNFLSNERGKNPKWLSNIMINPVVETNGTKCAVTSEDGAVSDIWWYIKGAKQMWEMCFRQRELELSNGREGGCGWLSGVWAVGLTRYGGDLQNSHPVEMIVKGLACPAECCHWWLCCFYRRDNSFNVCSWMYLGICLSLYRRPCLELGIWNQHYIYFRRFFFFFKVENWDVHEMWLYPTIALALSCLIQCHHLTPFFHGSQKAFSVLTIRAI